MPQGAAPYETTKPAQMMPDAPDMAAGGGADYASAGTNAAATAASIISQAVAAQAQRDYAAQQSSLDRATREKLARMQLTESAYEANTGRQADAYKMLLSAFSNNINNTTNSLANKRNAAKATDELLAQAMLRR
jgi:hypothetical protein